MREDKADEEKSLSPAEEKAEKFLKQSRHEKAAEQFEIAAERDPSKRAELLHRAAVAYWRAGVFEKARAAFQTAAERYSSVGNRAGEARNLMGLGASYNELKRTSEAYKTMHDALKTAEESGDRNLVASVQNWLGIICKEQGDFTMAVDYHRQALDIYRELEDAGNEASSLNSLGLTYYHMGSYDRAMECFKSAIDLLEELDLPWSLSDVLNSMGMTLRKMGRSKESLESYKRALAVRQKSGGKARIANILNNIGNLYTSMEEYEKAVKHHSEALSIREEISSRSGMASSLYNLGEAWMKAGKHHKASTALQRSLGFQHGDSPNDLMLDTYSLLARVRNRLGDTDKAYEMSSRALELSRQLYTDQVEKRVAESREILETEYRIREAKLLINKNRKLEDLSDMLSAQKEQLQLILDYVPAIIVFMDNSGTVIRLNNYAADLVGRKPAELVGSSAEEIFQSLGSMEPIGRNEEKLSLRGEEYTFRCQRVPYRGRDMSVRGIVLFAVDITEEKNAEKRKEEFRTLANKAERLESLGYLAGSIAHDFNNILLGIMGNVEIVLGRTSDARSRSSLEKASQNVRRATGLCSQLLAFSGGGNFVSRRIDLSEEVAFTIRSFSFDPEVRLNFKSRMNEELPKVEVAPSQLNMALKNLIAVIEERAGNSCEVTVTTGEVYVDDDYLKGRIHEIDPVRGEYLYVDLALASRIFGGDELNEMFDPFTSGNVLKNDLRVPAVHGILKSHGGFLTCSAEEGSGECIRIHFPCNPEGSGDE
ncbi:MAG: tetratricopeptide repeat protein, partial [Candidatus Aegiribacteria sp.]|nr:tetratricopeptide repeat protein [Candidatus Aegiribacteria sp.]MBD3294944.1 tetratricopeptide repeat protein [Candidatus Fermentibacteria bacterium]